MKFSILCDKHSQISFDLEPKKSDENYRSLTLQFSNKLCKVYLDTYEKTKYMSQLRHNMSLFSTKLGIENIFEINFVENIFIVHNEIQGIKNYKLDNTLQIKEYTNLVIHETYAPNGPGIYTIKLIRPLAS